MEAAAMAGDLAARGNSKCFRKVAAVPELPRAERPYNAFVAHGWTFGSPEIGLGIASLGRELLLPRAARFPSETLHLRKARNS